MGSHEDRSGRCIDQGQQVICSGRLILVNATSPNILVRWLLGTSGKSCQEKACPVCRNNINRNCGDSCADELEKVCDLNRQEVLQQQHAHVFMHPKYSIGECLAGVDGRFLKIQFIKDHGLSATSLELRLRVQLAVVMGADFDKLTMKGLGVKRQGQPILQTVRDIAISTPGGTLMTLRLKDGEAALPDLCVISNKEKDLGDYSFCIVISAVDAEGRVLGEVTPAVSPLFRLSASPLFPRVPMVHDHVARLSGIHYHAATTLGCLSHAANISGLDLGTLGESDIRTVADFQKLVSQAQQDTQHSAKLLALLDMDAKQWACACEDAERAVEADNLMRAWLPDPRSVDGGLLFPCSLSRVQLSRAVGVLRKLPGPGEHLEAVVTLTPEQLVLVAQLRVEAERCWYLPQHPGWNILPIDSIQFMESLEQFAPMADAVAVDDGCTDNTVATEALATPGQEYTLAHTLLENLHI